MKYESFNRSPVSHCPLLRSEVHFNSFNLPMLSSLYRLLNSDTQRTHSIVVSPHLANIPLLSLWSRQQERHHISSSNEQAVLVETSRMSPTQRQNSDFMRFRLHSSANDQKGYSYLNSVNVWWRRSFLSYILSFRKVRGWLKILSRLQTFTATTLKGRILMG